jgi:hypothetical protein
MKKYMKKGIEGEKDEVNRKEDPTNPPLLKRRLKEPHHDV